jgi:hypothetical protein
MRRDTLRYLVILGILALGTGVSLVIQAAPRVRPVMTPTPGEAAATPRYVFLTDLAGWYATTPDERAVASPYALGRATLAQALPLDLAGWHGTDLGFDPDIESLYAQPDVVLRRQYADTGGQSVWVTAINSHGAKSFHLFEHTPGICYVSAGWRPVQEDVCTVTLAHGSLPLRRGVYEREGQRQVVYSWYQWDSPARDAERGITSWRLTAEAPNGQAQAEQRLAHLVSLLFQEVLPWHRF